MTSNVIFDGGECFDAFDGRSCWTTRTDWNYECTDALLYGELAPWSEFLCAGAIERSFQAARASQAQDLFLVVRRERRLDALRPPCVYQITDPILAVLQRRPCSTLLFWEECRKNRPESRAFPGDKGSQSLL